MKKQVSFKKRKVELFIKEPQLLLGNAGIFFFNHVQLEFLYLKFLRRRIRYIWKKRAKRSFNRQVWLNLKPNYPLSQKSKNARMGKGKGMFMRWIVIVKGYYVFAEFFGFNAQLLFTLTKKLGRIFPTKLYFITLQKKRLLKRIGFGTVYHNQQLKKLKL